MKNIILVVVLLIGKAGYLNAQQVNYPARINALHQLIESRLKDKQTGLYYETTDSTKNENKHSWLWPLCAAIQAANEMEALEPQKSYMQPIERAIDAYYNAEPSTPAYQDYVTKERVSSRFYDDNEWIAIAYLDAYTRNHKRKYLETSEMIYRFVLSGIDTITGGGVYWKEGDHTTKNTCSNGPAILVALQLYNINHKPEYLQTAQSLYKWTNDHLQATEGFYYDNIKMPSLKIAKAVFTYNTGTMLQANVSLYHATGNQQYLDEAKRIAAAGREHFFKDGRLPKEYWFNVVMLRAYQALYKVDRNQEWIDFFKQDADWKWQHERDTDGFVGAKPVKRLIDQAAMIETYARLEQIKKM